MTTVWSCGGGTQSAAIAVMILQGMLPKPDLIVMADTSRECTETWEYLEHVMRPALLGAHLEVNIVSHTYAYWDIVKEKKDDILLPLFTRLTGKISKMPTFCSNEWKRRPVQRWLRKQGVEDCDVWLGMSTDEMERMKFSYQKWYRHVYPLIEMVPTARHGCISTVEQFGWPKPPKSRCWMCPNQSPYEWRDLQARYPGDFQKAVSLEQDLWERDPYVFLHELAIPLDKAVKQSAVMRSMFDGCDSGYCWT